MLILCDTALTFGAQAVPQSYGTPSSSSVLWKTLVLLLGSIFFLQPLQLSCQGLCKGLAYRLAECLVGGGLGFVI